MSPITYANASTVAITDVAATEQNPLDALPPTIKNAVETLNWSPLSTVLGAALNAGTGALTAVLFTSISPLGGAIFGISSWATSHVVSWICDKVNCCPDSIIYKVAAFALPTIAGIGAGAAALSLAGFEITASTLAVMVVGGFALTTAFGAVGCCVALPVIGAVVFYNIVKNLPELEEFRQPTPPASTVL